MKKIFKFSIIVILLILFSQPFYSYGQTPGYQIQVGASVGELYLNLSGYASPFASIVLTSNGVFLRSVVADQNGDFFISQVLINMGFSNFCLDTVDVKRLGDAYVCFNIPPAQQNVTINDIFLPPTLGLERNVIDYGGEAVAFGYTKPNATVHLTIGSLVLTGTADNTGYYEFHIKNLSPGTYDLIAQATYNKRISFTSQRKVTLHERTLLEQLGSYPVGLVKNGLNNLLAIPLGPLWFAIPILILIFIQLKRLFPWITTIWNKLLYPFAPFFDHFNKRKKLHHAWFEGVGY